jgi:hypothetical protein
MCRSWQAQIDHAPSRELIELAESYADGQIRKTHLRRVRRAVYRWAHEIWEVPTWPKEWIPHWAAWNAAVPSIVPPCVGFFDTERGFEPYAADVFGDPLCPVGFDPSWRTSAALALAQSMYESRDFAAMPILADALEEAGCCDPDILSH